MMLPRVICVLLAIAVCYGNTVYHDTSRDLEDISSRLRIYLTDHFNENRHRETNPVNRDNVRNYIKDTMDSYNLEVHLQYYHYGIVGQPYGVAINIIGVLPGQLIGTASDQVILLGAHYDSESSTPGVNDNGSGMAVLLDAAAMVTSNGCQRKNTVIFVAFDEERHYYSKGQFGSDIFVQEWLPSFLANDDGTNSTFHGALIVDTAMNYKSANDSQTTPDGFKESFPEANDNLETRGFRGDFLYVVGRRTDADLNAMLVRHLAKIDHADPTYYTETIELPIEGVPSRNDDEAFPDFFKSDHISFWEVGPPYFKALFITDSGYRRYPMIECGGVECDDVLFVKRQNLLFLARTALASTTMIEELAMEDCPVDYGVFSSSKGLASSENALLITVSMIVSRWI